MFSATSAYVMVKRIKHLMCYTAVTANMVYYYNIDKWLRVQTLNQDNHFRYCAIDTVGFNQTARAALLTTRGW